jgi:hypothetical protein
MKKIIVTLAISIFTLTAFATGENVNAKVLGAFNSEFSGAQDVEWTVGTGYYTAAFVYNQKHVYAYYNEEGELLGISRYLSPDDLPVTLQAGLKNRFGNYWVSDLFEVTKNDETAYYITIENADAKIVLKSNGSEWAIFKKVRKA